MRNLAIVVLLWFPSAALGEGWLCVADKSQGFNYDKATKEWDATKFKPDEKYLVRRAKKPSYIWEVVRVGEVSPEFSCDSDFGTTEDLICHDLSDFRFNKKLLKFVVSRTYGYFARVADVPTMQPDSVLITIGRCTSI